jgi:hypothetical protein
VSAKPNASIAHVAEVKRKIEQVPSAERRAELQVKFARTVTDMARKIRDAARRK